MSLDAPQPLALEHVLTYQEIRRLIAQHTEAMRHCREGLQRLEAAHATTPSPGADALIYTQLKAEYRFHCASRADYRAMLYRAGIATIRDGTSPAEIQHYHDFIADREMRFQALYTDTTANDDYSAQHQQPS